MARGPFQGTFQPNARPTVVTAPDALVYLNGEVEIVGCPSCNRKFDIHKYVTSIQVDLNIDSVPGSASVNLVVPRHAIDDFYFDGVPVISPMMEIEIFAKGHFLVEGVPQYYPIFWGLVNEVTDQYSSGQHSIAINCSDILKWWELCKMNINPAWTGQKTTQMGWDMFGNVFHGMNPYDVIWTLAQEAVGDVVVGTGSLTSFNGEKNQKSTFATAISDMMLYWQNRFSRVRNNLLLYGVQGVAVRGDTLWEEYRTTKPAGSPFVSTAVRRANGGQYGGGVVFDVTSEKVTAFKTQASNAGLVNFWQSEYQTKLEIANAAKEAIGFEFYMDVTGDIVFKPPFYNLDTLPNKPVSWIQDIDIIDWDFSESESEVVTQVQMSGSYAGSIDYGMPQEVEPFTSVTDWHLLRKYGWRTHQVNSEFLGDPVLMFYHGLDILDRLNSRRHRGTVTIPLRPELRLGFPIYVAPKDQMWYVSGISHSIQFGGTAQTTLTLTARRGKFFAPRGIGTLELKSWDKDAVKTAGNAVSKPSTNRNFKYTSRQLSDAGVFEIQVGGAANMPVDDIAVFAKPAAENPYSPLILRHPKTGRACGFPNVVMAYTRPFASAKPLTQTGTQQHQNNLSPVTDETLMARGADLAGKVGASLKASKADALRIKYMQNRYMYGLNSAGVFTYLYDKGGMSSEHNVSEILLVNTARVTVLPKSTDSAVNQFKLKSDAQHSSMVRPVSDERGFEVVGHFRYGRGVSLRDGSLVLSDGGTNQRANISIQLALTGNLSDTLAAQSKGLTTVTSAQPNPAANLATLTPDDQQGAAIQTPGMDKPKFAAGPNGEAPFVASAPLGSAAAEQLPQSVEATQLSRALSLAELTVKFQDGSDQACDCLMGRQDLTFISQGLKVSPLGDTTSASDTLKDPSKLDTSSPVEANKAFPVGRPEEVATLVNNFLYGLYSALDGPHQAWEKSLRGEVGTINDPYEALFGPPPSPTMGPVTPPFDAASRYVVQDLDAIVVQAQSNEQGLETAWNQFGEDLKRKPVLAALAKRSAQLQQQAAQIRSELANLSPSDPAYGQKKAALEATLAKIEQRRAQVDLKIDQISNGGAIDESAFALAAEWTSQEASDITGTTTGVSVQTTVDAKGAAVKSWSRKPTSI